MAFSGFGTIREVEMQYSTDTDSATATIVYDSEQACAAAIAQFDNTVADGRVLRITMVPRMRSLAGLAAQPAGRSLAAEQNHMQVDQPMHTAGPPQQESLASRIAAAASYADRIEADQLARKARISKLGLRGPQALLANAVAAARASMSGPTTTFVNTQ
ncbi:hypothetical protein HK105_200800 [Polyrhizophydium stewartii]|uniref:RRM domain-containing protein n=1 Tax=Polyrhizophydium stewartii TaxID=2732419 RepID=A0ABR4NK19_9FUNG